MGKATRWLRSLFTSSKKPQNPNSQNTKKNWSNTGGGFDRRSSYGDDLDANKHAIAVAAATAAVAEAALAAAHAAAEVVRLTTTGSSRNASANVICAGATSAAYPGGDRRRALAAVRIQAAFRAYLARKALRALKGLVKIQALVRGHIVRKRSADMLRRMQAMARVQARACANRSCVSGSSRSSSRSSQSICPLQRPDPKLNAWGREKPVVSSHWLERWMEDISRNKHKDNLAINRPVDDEKSDKILEIDTWKPQLKKNASLRSSNNSKHNSAWIRNERNLSPAASLSRLPSKSHKRNASPLSRERFIEEADQAVWMEEYSPAVSSASSRPGTSSRRSLFSPTKSEYSRNLFDGYPSYPNYMANTESSRARLRSQSAPRQRMQFEKPGSVVWDADSYSERGLSSPANIKTIPYPGGSH